MFQQSSKKNIQEEHQDIKETEAVQIKTALEKPFQIFTSLKQDFKSTNNQSEKESKKQKTNPRLGFTQFKNIEMHDTNQEILLNNGQSIQKIVLHQDFLNQPNSPSQQRLYRLIIVLIAFGAISLACFAIIISVISSEKFANWQKILFSVISLGFTIMVGCGIIYYVCQQHCRRFCRRRNNQVVNTND